MTENRLVTKYPEFVTVLYECARDNRICSVRAQEEGIDCWKHCAACSDVCVTTAKWITLGDPAMSSALQKLVDVTLDACQKCSEVCGRHNNPHCRKCSESSAACVDAAKAFLADQRR